MEQWGNAPRSIKESLTYKDLVQRTILFQGQIEQVQQCEESVGSRCKQQVQVGKSDGSLSEHQPCVRQVVGSNPRLSNTNHLKSGTYCFLVKRLPLKGQNIMEKLVSWRCRVLGKQSSGNLKTHTSLNGIGLCGLWLRIVLLYGATCYHIPQLIILLTYKTTLLR